MNIQQLFEQHLALPSPPNVVKELIQSFQNEDIAIHEITKTIALDQVISAKLLRLANSAHFHASHSIGTIDQAVGYIGFNTTRTLIISSGLTSSFKPQKGFQLEYFWRYSLHTAVVAKWLAVKTKNNSELAFTIGLMHAIGQLIMHTAMPEKCKEIDQIIDIWHDERIAHEQSMLGYHYANISAELSRRWGFPPVFAEVIDSFPEVAITSTHNPMAAIIYIAAWFSRAQKNALTIEQMQSEYPCEVGNILGLEFEQINESMPSLDELCDGFDDLIM
jgi:HD-like signal output (HDOD) protein